MFKIDPKGNETVLHNFTDGADGGMPGDLVRDQSGNLYGAADSGGSFVGNTCGPYGGCGVIYKLDTSGTFSVFHTFQGGDDGGLPYGRLLLSKGHLYGTTFLGGSYYEARVHL